MTRSARRIFVAAFGAILLVLSATDVRAISVGGFGPGGESGRRNSQEITIGDGGEVFELDAFLAIGAAASLRLSEDALPPDLAFSFEPILSEDESDLSLVYSFRNDGAALDEVRFFSFLDVEIDEEVNSFSNEYAVVSGSLGAGAEDGDPDGFEVDEAGFVFGDIISHLAIGALDDTNAIPVGTPECVAMALAFDLGSLAPGETVRIEVLISEDGTHLGSLSIVQADTDPGSTTTVTFSGFVTRDRPVESGSFVRGDFDGDAVLSAADAEAVRSRLLDDLSGEGESPRGCLGEPIADVADANDNEWLTIADFVAARDAAARGTPLPAPFPGCGEDPDEVMRGFDSIDVDYLVAAGELEIVPPVGAMDRDLHVPVLVRSPTAVTAATVMLRFDSSSLIPFDPTAGDAALLESDLVNRGLAASQVFVDAPAGVIVLAIWASEPDATILDGDAEALQELGVLRFHIEDFAIVQPFEWLEEHLVESRRFRSTVVDTLHEDHHPGASGGEFAFVRGNSNNDSRVDLSDSVFTLNYLFLGGVPPVCLDAADANNDSRIDISDGVYSLNFLFLGGPIIPTPYPLCGLDEGPVDLLGCSPCACPPYAEGHPCNP